MKQWTGAAIVLGVVVASAGTPVAQSEVTSYVRYEESGQAHYGILEAETIRQISGPPWDGGQPTGRRVEVTDVTLLAPAEPSKVIAVGANYRSHTESEVGRALNLDELEGKDPPLFAKLPSVIVGTGDDIVRPEGSTNLHFEGELVVVIGKTASHVSAADAADHVFGVTAGNDVSERDWQAGDLQWLRAKASDTFGPIGPAIVRGLDYGDLLLTTRVNGEVMQEQRTSDLIFPVAYIISYVSRYVTLNPGDLIFTGTPGETSAMEPGDVVEVEIEGVGTLQNRVAAP